MKVLSIINIFFSSIFFVFNIFCIPRFTKGKKIKLKQCLKNRIKPVDPTDLTVNRQKNWYDSKEKKNRFSLY